MKYIYKILSVLTIFSVFIFMLPRLVNAAPEATFMEPGGDADFAVTTTNGFWAAITGTPTIVTDFVNSTHVKSINLDANGGFGEQVSTPANSLTDAGTRISFYLYIKTLPAAASSILFLFQGGSSSVVELRLTAGGVLQLWDTTTAQIGTNGSTLSTGTWYRISLAYQITSTTVNRFEQYVNGVSSISITNATLTRTTTSRASFGTSNGSPEYRMSDFYTEWSSSLDDTGNVLVTAKRPNANGTTNGFTTQVGAGGSGYGSGHAPQVNERPLSTTNGWSMVGAGSAVTEEYNIESASTGDMDLTGRTILGYTGWVSMKSLAPETAQIIVNGVSTASTTNSTNSVYKVVVRSSTYPAGTGADIGITTDTSLTTVTLNEAGIIFASIPTPAPAHAILTIRTGTFTLRSGTMTLP